MADSTKKFLKQVNGDITEEKALASSTGASDADRVPATGAQGYLHPTLLNATQAGGTGAEGKIAQLDGTGRLDSTMLPVGIGADTASVTASENLAAGDLVNLYNNAGTINARKADGATGKAAHGYVLAAVTSGNPATVYFDGTDGQLSGMTVGRQFLSVTTPGRTQATAPTAAGHIVQEVGVALSATALTYHTTSPITLA